jgi:uncharacterized integral membrane protein
VTDERLTELHESPVPGVIPDRTYTATGAGPPAANGATEPAEPSGGESDSRPARQRPRGRRFRLYLYAFLTVALLVYVIALAGANTRHVRADWVFGTSSVPLVLLVTFAAVLGWLLGLLMVAAFRWRTRARRPS